jgi:hypothetical protein
MRQLTASQKIAVLENRVAQLEKQARATEYNVSFGYTIHKSPKHDIEDMAEIVDAKIKNFLTSKGAKVKEPLKYSHDVYKPEFGGSYIVDAKPDFDFKEEFEKLFNIEGEVVEVYFSVVRNTIDLEILAQVRKPRSITPDVWNAMIHDPLTLEIQETLIENGFNEDVAFYLPIARSPQKFTWRWSGSIRVEQFHKLKKRKKLPSGNIVTFRYKK